MFYMVVSLNFLQFIIISYVKIISNLIKFYRESWEQSTASLCLSLNGCRCVDRKPAWPSPTRTISQDDDGLIIGEPAVAGEGVTAAWVGHGEHSVLEEPVWLAATPVLVHLQTHEIANHLVPYAERSLLWPIEVRPGFALQFYVLGSIRRTYRDWTHFKQKFNCFFCKQAGRRQVLWLRTIK